MYLKWAGGKTRLAGPLLSLFPQTGRGKYIEPFFGSGAMYFAFRQTVGEPDIFGKGFSPSMYRFGDKNPILVNCHLSVQADIDSLIEILARKEKEHASDPKGYFDAEKKLVTQDPDLLNGYDLESAARFIYINKSCFNGLWRVNRSGRFNVPWNQQNEVNLISDKLYQAHRMLQGCDLHLCDFEQLCAEAEEGDFVYLDPPYVPVSDSSSFTAYTEDGFTEEDLMDLRQTCDFMTSKGVKWMMSNSASPLVYDVFQYGPGHSICEIDAPRFIKALKEDEKREMVKETVVTNYL